MHSEEQLLLATDAGEVGLWDACEQLISLFEPFRQFNSPGRSNTGLEIGLALAKQPVELHGGVIEARSAGLGYDSEFVVTLPSYVSKVS